MYRQKESIIANRLDWLFKNILHPDGREYKYTEVQDATEKIGRKVTSSYIGKLRRGEQTNPAWDVVSILAQFFGVPITFFFQEKIDEAELERFKIAATIQDENVQEIALYAGRLSTERKQAILEVLKSMVSDG